jgi:hypothetical protein
VAEKETEKGLMHSFFGEELCMGCKGMLVVAFIAPTQKDVGSFAAAFSRFQKDADGNVGTSSPPGMSAARTPRVRTGTNFVDSPTRKPRAKKNKR